MFSSMLSLLGSLRGGSSFVTNSLRFRSSASAYLSRTPAASGSLTAWTMSMWVKRGTLSVLQNLFGALTGVGATTEISFLGNDSLAFIWNTSNYIQTSAVFRDPSAWYHIVAVWDSNNATPADRAIIYVNNVRQSVTLGGSYPTLGLQSYWNRNLLNTICRFGSSAHFDGYLTDVNFIDGQALTPASFGAIDSSTGVWAPRPYSGTYGTNGFYLKFANTSSVAALGNDSSGNSNTWTVNNVSLTAGATYDSMIDVPVNYSDGGNGRGNYAVLNPLDQVGITCSGGNLNYSSGLSGDFAVRGTMFNASGKWYFEWEQSTTPQVGQVIGVANTSQVLNQTNQHVVSTNLWGFNTGDGQKCNGGQSAYGTAVAANVVVGVAVDMDAGKIYFRNASGYFGSGDPVAGTNAAFTNLTGQSVAPYYYDGNSGSSPVGGINFGQRPFAYTPPAGFRALNTNNLPTPSIVNGANFMAATTYTGNAAARSLSNAVNSVSFQPDLVWIKSRTPGATSHALFNSTRGTTKYLSSNTAGLETTNANTLTAFGADGFSLGTDTTLVNANANSYIAWQWKESVASGLDVVTYSGTLTTGGTVAINHNLGVAPNLVISKSLTPTGADVGNWFVWHASAGTGNFLRLNTTDQANSISGGGGGTMIAPTSSVFYTPYVSGANVSGNNYVAYCFAQIAGFSRFGSYTGNGSADGPFVFCGFRPRWVMVKDISAGSTNWWIIDSARNIFNLSDKGLLANDQSQELTASSYLNVDLTASGFKLRSGDNVSSQTNFSGRTYIFAAFAETPSKYALAR